MASRLPVEPTVLRWAADRSGREPDEIAAKFPGFARWLADEQDPTWNQLQQVAGFFKIPLGLLFLSSPPAQEISPLPDFRTVDSTRAEVTPDILDSITWAEARQEWFRNYAVRHGLPAVTWVRSRTTEESPVEAATTMRTTLGYDEVVGIANRSDPVKGLSQAVEAAGGLVMITGIVGGNTRRTLDPEEFRGFSLLDEFAPVIFVNGTDTKSAQLFTLAHELGHLLLGTEGIDKPVLTADVVDSTEIWCNAFAAEFLVPETDLLAQEATDAEVSTLDALARRYRVSTLVILRRLTDAGVVPKSEYATRSDQEWARVKKLWEEARAKQKKASSSGNFYTTQPVRLGRRLTRAVIEDTIEGGTMYGDAFRLIGSRKIETFNGLAERLGVPA